MPGLFVCGHDLGELLQLENPPHHLDRFMLTMLTLFAGVWAQTWWVRPSFNESTSSTKNPPLSIVTFGGTINFWVVKIFDDIKFTREKPQKLFQTEAMRKSCTISIKICSYDSWPFEASKPSITTLLPENLPKAAVMSYSNRGSHTPTAKNTTKSNEAAKMVTGAFFGWVFGIHVKI